jgi:hypothetical protein
MVSFLADSRILYTVSLDSMGMGTGASAFRIVACMEVQHPTLEDLHRVALRVTHAADRLYH